MCLLEFMRCLADLATGGLRHPLQKILQVMRLRAAHRMRSAVVVMLVLSACASLPEPTPPPKSPAISNAPLEQQLVVRDRNGAVPPVTERKVLAGVSAEGQGDLTQHHLKVLAAAGEADVYQGNAARLLVDGPATFAAMKSAITRARGRVLLESYIVDDSAMADELARLLSSKVSQGVQVALIYDGLGSFGTPPAYFDRLAAAGVAVCKFNPVNPLERPGYWGINHRDHRKVLVVDQEVAFTGGINISRAYSSGSGGPSRSIRRRRIEGRLARHPHRTARSGGAGVRAQLRERSGRRRAATARSSRRLRQGDRAGSTRGPGARERPRRPSATASMRRCWLPSGPRSAASG